MEYLVSRTVLCRGRYFENWGGVGGCCVCLVCVYATAVFSIHCLSERFCSIYFSLVYFAPLSYSTLSWPLFDVMKNGGKQNFLFYHCGKYVYHLFQHGKY